MDVHKKIVNGELIEHTVDGIDQIPNSPTFGQITRPLGDKIASNPIVHAIGKITGCVDKNTHQLKPDSGCGKMKARLNAGMSITGAMKLRIQGK